METDVFYGPMLRVSTVTCRDCGRVLKQTLRRIENDDDGRRDVVDQPCSPSFAQVNCDSDAHPPRLPDASAYGYSNDGCPLFWNVRYFDV